MSSDVAIRVESMGKQYRIGGKQAPYKTLRESLTGLATAPFRRWDRKPSDTIWALKNISFEVKRGEVIGVIGRNGAGKSTLLKILSRITEPTEGWAEIHGRVGSLLEVGTGFHPELTGRENTYLNGAILGMRREEIERKFDEIVAFAGIEKFIETPVKYYSSGMYVRLAFAVAAHLEPEILVVDEVLAVGDAEFQRKCLNKMQDVTNRGRTVLFVSHNMAAIRNLCARTLLLEKGGIEYEGETQAAVARYLERQAVHGAKVSGEELDRSSTRESWTPQGVEYFRCNEIALLDPDGQPLSSFVSNQDITLAVGLECIRDVPNLQILVILTNEDDVPILRTEFQDDPSSRDFYFFRPGLYRLQCRLPRNLFGERRFYVTVALICQSVHHLQFKNILKFDIEFAGYNDNLSVHSKQAFFRPQLHWQVDFTPTTQPTILSTP